MGITGDEGIFAEERKKMIVDIVNRNTKATVSELCEKFSVSSATIRNDLRELAEFGLLERTHGGALQKSSVNFELNTVEKEVICVDQKKAIAKAALKYIKEGASIALDAGTTCLEVAKLLAPFRELTVVTHDLNIASCLDNSTDVSVIIAGGQLRKGFHYTIGDLAQNALKDLNVDVAFIAVNGIHCEKGMSTPKFETGTIKRVLMNNAKQVIVLADRDKINFVSFAKFAELEEADVIITDSGADENFVETVRMKGIKVELA